MSSLGQGIVRIDIRRHVWLDLLWTPCHFMRISEEPSSKTGKFPYGLHPISIASCCHCGMSGSFVASSRRFAATPHSLLALSRTFVSLPSLSMPFVVSSKPLVAFLSTQFLSRFHPNQLRMLTRVHMRSSFFTTSGILVCVLLYLVPADGEEWTETTAEAADDWKDGLRWRAGDWQLDTSVIA